MTTATKTYRVMIVDDHPIVREGLDLLISGQADLEVCGHAEGVAEAMSLLEETEPDLAIVDLSLADGSGIELIRRMRAKSRAVRVLVSSMYDETLYAERALHAGAMGYLNKQESTRKLMEAIRRILSGKVFLSERMSERLLHRLVGAGEDPVDLSVERLSDRELEVLEHIGNGVRTSDIAERMNLSVKTVETYRQRIRRKLALENGAALASYASQWILENR